MDFQFAFPHCKYFYSASYYFPPPIHHKNYPSSGQQYLSTSLHNINWGESKKWPRQTNASSYSVIKFPCSIFLSSVTQGNKINQHFSRDPSKLNPRPDRRNEWGQGISCTTEWKRIHPHTEKVVWRRRKLGESTYLFRFFHSLVAKYLKRPELVNGKGAKTAGYTQSTVGKCPIILVIYFILSAETKLVLSFLQKVTIPIKLTTDWELISLMISSKFNFQDVSGRQ